MRQVGLAVLGLLLGLAVRGHAGTVPDPERDLSYGSDAKQRLDLSVPAGSGFPTVVFVHGGGLTSGDKADEDYENVCKPFPEAGVACASVNYRLAPGSAWPTPAEDVAAAVAWVRANIGLRGGDPRQLFLLGHSSGAMLVALMGTDPRYLDRQDLEPGDLRGVMPMGSIMWDDETQQALETYGREAVEESFARDPGNRIYESFDAYLELWPIHHVAAGQPPFLFLIAEGEQEQPPVSRTNLKFVESARALGNEADCAVLPERTHMSAIRKLSEPGDPVFAVVLDFIRKFADTARN